MAILNTTHKRKSAVITAIILLLFILGIFNYGMQYLDPPEEYGLAINFGDAAVGSGEPVLLSKKTPPKEVLKAQEEVKAVTKAPQETVQEDIIVEERTTDVPVIEKVKDKEPKPLKRIIKKEVEKIKPKSKPSKENQDALNKLLNGASPNGAEAGEGDDTVAGNKGKKEGDPAASKYYGNTGNGSGGDYNLSGRKALSKPKKQPDCQQEGTVVVQITVDNNGRVISAVSGAKGTTNTAPCLAKPAREAALNTKWNPDADAPKIQTGTIIYKFSLSK